MPPRAGRPVLCQAGASPKGRAFAAKYADTIIAMGTTVEGMKAYRDDIRERLVGHGRKPDDCKVLFLVSPMVDETDELAHAKARRWIEDPLYIEWVLTEISSITEVDFSGKVAIVLGNEGKGIRRNVSEHCDRTISIPMRGHVESLNVAAAAAVVCYEVVRGGESSR